MNQRKELVFHRRPCHRHRRVLESTEGDENFRSLFAPYVAGASSSRPPQGKKPRGYCQVKETWTHDFFCLAGNGVHNVQLALTQVPLASPEKHNRN